MVARFVASAVALGVTISTHAVFTGVKLVIDPALNTRARAALAAAGVPDADTAVVIRVYATFNAPGDGSVNTVLTTGFMNIVPLASGISFYQDPAGGLKAPNSIFFPFAPTLEFDTFGTIGILDAINGDSTAISPNSSMSQSSITGGWFNSNPPNNNGAATDQGGFFGTLLFQITVLGPGVSCSNNPYAALMGSGSIFAQDPNDGGSFGPLSPPCPGELSGNLIVNSADLAMLLSRWGSPPPVGPCAGAFDLADLNSDGVVDSGDLAVLLANWGCSP